MITQIVFGPVPSRRLGTSLGVNNIPPKHCSYSCVYCQVGRTIFLDIKRQKFYDPEKVVSEVTEYAIKVGLDRIDFITFVPDGEPTLDKNLGVEIQGVKENLGKKIAVITNGSLLWIDDVKEDLYNSDWVSVKVDAVTGHVYKRVDRPHPHLNLELVLHGIRKFSDEYTGTLVTETMLVKGLNDSVEELFKIAEFLAQIDPSTAYISVPTRPPAEPWVEPPDEHTLLQAYEIFRETLGDKVELLIGFEGGEFHIDPEKPVESILGIISVHPLRLDVAESLLREKRIDPRNVIETITSKGDALITEFHGRRFLVRRIKRIRE